MNESETDTKMSSFEKVFYPCLLTLHLDIFLTLQDIVHLRCTNRYFSSVQKNYNLLHVPLQGIRFDSLISRIQFTRHKKNKYFLQYLFSNYKITHLKYGQDRDYYSLFSKPLSVAFQSLHSSLQHLEFSKDFDKSINLDKFINLTDISFGLYYNKNLYFNNLCFLKTITLGLCFDKKIFFNNLVSLSILKFGNFFNRPLYNLPKNLKILEFGFFFNQKISLPIHLECIIFGDRFDKYIIFPDSVKKIFFGSNFGLLTKQVTVLPPYLTHLRIGIFFDENIIIPNTLEYLEVPFNFSETFISNIAKNVVIKKY